MVVNSRLSAGHSLTTAGRASGEDGPCSSWNYEFGRGEEREGKV